MREVVYVPKAREDLDAIGRYTANRWDIEQADAYVRQISLTCVGLATGTVSGRDAGDIRPGYRKRAAGSHVIFYQELPDTIVVIRILHQRMDLPGHFD